MKNSELFGLGECQRHSVVYLRLIEADGVGL